MDVYCIVNQNISIESPTRKCQLAEPLAYNNALAHAMRVTVFNEDGSAADLTGVGVVASFLKSNNETVEPINGTVSGNVAQVILPASCYVTPGRFTFTMNLSKTGGYSRTALWVDGIVERNTTSTIIDPGTPVSDISQAISQANAAASSATAAAAAANAAATAASGHFTNYGGIQCGTDSEATASYTAALGWDTEASGSSSQAFGSHTIANHAGQHVFGAWNVADPSEADSIYPGNYIEIVGNGNSSARSNARTLDWQGNEVLAGTITADGVNLNESIGNLYGVKTSTTFSSGHMTFLNVDIKAGETVYVDVAIDSTDDDKSYMIALSPNGSTLLTGIRIDAPGMTTIVAPQDCVMVAVYYIKLPDAVSVKAFTSSTLSACRRINEALPIVCQTVEHTNGTMATVPLEVMQGDVVYVNVSEVVATGFNKYEIAFGNNTSSMTTAFDVTYPGVTRQISPGRYSNVYVYFDATAVTSAKITVCRESAKSVYGTFSVLGDSYSAYTGTIPSGNAASYPITGNDVNDPSQMWWSRFGAQMGATLERNESWTGSSVCNFSYNVDCTASSFVTRMKNLPESDVILILGGTNDAWGSAALGNYKYSGWTTIDLNSFRPAYAYMLYWLRSNRPASEIVCIINDLGSTYADYITSMETIAAHYSVPVVKLSGISKISNHPNKAGMAEIGAQTTSKVLEKHETGQEDGGLRALGEQVDTLQSEVVIGTVAEFQAYLGIT